MRNQKFKTALFVGSLLISLSMISRVSLAAPSCDRVNQQWAQIASKFGDCLIANLTDASGQKGCARVYVSQAQGFSGQYGQEETCRYGDEELDQSFFIQEVERSIVTISRQYGI